MTDGPESGRTGAHVIGFPGCYPNPYALKMMQRLATHPNVGAVLLVSLGCEGFNKRSEKSRSEEHTSELQSLMRISYAVFFLKKKKEINKKRSRTNANQTTLTI